MSRSVRRPRLRRPVPRAQVRRELETLWQASGLPGGFTLRWPRHMAERHRRSPRSYAQVRPTLPPVFELAPQVCQLPYQHRLALLAHEVGHVLDPQGSEDDADRAAERALGVKIGYDKRWPGKGLQVAMNPPVTPDPQDVEGFAAWLASEAERKAAAEGVAAPRTLTSFDPRPVEVEPGVIYFASGSNHPGEIRGLADVGLGVGVAAPECMLKSGEPSPCERALIALAGTGVPVFVDSGAFSEVTFGPQGPSWPVPIEHEDWLKILAFYTRLARALGPQLYFVAPDRVADQQVTLERMQRYAAQVLHIKALGAKVLAPIQKGGLSMADFYLHVTGILGPDVIAAIPMKKDATTYAQFREFLQQVGPSLYGIHLLGLGPYGQIPRGEPGPDSASVEEVIAVARQLAPQAHLSQDSVLIRSAVGWGKLGVVPRLLTQAGWLAGETMAPAMWGSTPSLHAQTPEYWDDEAGAWLRIPDRDEALMDPSSFLTGAQLKQLGKGWGLDKQQLKSWVEDPESYLQDDSEGISFWELPHVQHDLEQAWAKWVDDRLTATRKRMGIGYAFQGSTPAKLPEYVPPPVPEGRQGVFWAANPPPAVQVIREVGPEEVAAEIARQALTGHNVWSWTGDPAAHAAREADSIMGSYRHVPHLLVRVPLELVGMQWDPSGRDPDAISASDERERRTREYAAIPTPFPPIYLTLSETSARRRARRGAPIMFYAANGNHRAAAAVLRGDSTIDAFMPASAMEVFNTVKANPLPPELRPVRDAKRQAKHEKRMARKAAARVYGFDPELAVLERDCVEGERPGWRDDYHAWEQQLRDVPGWIPPEGGQDQWIVTAEGPKMVDGGFARRAGPVLAEHVRALLAGERPWYDETPRDLAWDVLMDGKQGRIPPDQAAQLLRGLREAGDTSEWTSEKQIGELFMARKNPPKKPWNKKELTRLAKADRLPDVQLLGDGRHAVVSTRYWSWDPNEDGDLVGQGVDSQIVDDLEQRLGGRPLMGARWRDVGPGWAVLSYDFRDPNDPMLNPPRSKLCQQGRHDFDEGGTCKRKGCEATLTMTMFPMSTTEEEQAYGFSATRAAQGFRPGDPQQGLFSNPPHPVIEKGATFRVVRPGASLTWPVSSPGGYIYERADLPVGTVLTMVGYRKGWGSDSYPPFPHFSLAGGPAAQFRPNARPWPHPDFPDMTYLEPVRSNPPVDFLPEDPWRYFLPVPGAQLVPLSMIRPIRAREGGIERAGRHMLAAYEGRGERRKPITLAPAPDGAGFVVADGNSTYANAARSGWSAIPAVVETDPSVLHNPPYRVNRPQYDELAEGGPQAKFLTGYNRAVIMALAGHQGRLSAKEIAAETTGYKASSVRKALKELVDAGYVRTWGSRGGFDQKAVMYEVTEKGLELAVEIERLEEEAAIVGLEDAMGDASFDPATFGGELDEDAGPDVPLGERLDYATYEADDGGALIEAYDLELKKQVGQIKVAPDPQTLDDDRQFRGHEGEYAPITYVRVHPKYRRAGVGTRLYELAAKWAARRGLALASADDRTRTDGAFWRKQERKRRAKLRRTSGTPSASRYFLRLPPPESLANPPMFREHYPDGRMVPVELDLVGVSLNPPPGWIEGRGPAGRRRWTHHSGLALVQDGYGRPHHARYQTLVRQSSGSPWIESGDHSSADAAFSLAQRDLASFGVHAY